MLIGYCFCREHESFHKIPLNPNGAEGHIVPTLFSEGYFSKQKGVWRSEISWLFLIIVSFQIIKKKCFFTVILGDLEGACTINHLSSDIQKPPTIRVNELKMVGFRKLQTS